MEEDKKNIEFRMVIVIQRSTGLPVYYEIIPGNVVDTTTIHRIMRLMARYGFRVTCVFGDAGYSCPANVEKVIFYGSDVVMRLNPAVAPFKAAVLPLSKKLEAQAREIEQQLAKYFNVLYDDTGSIGKRYRRQDAVGTPFCITVDFDTENDGAVTIRERDSMQQIRLPIGELKAYLEEKVFF